MEFLLREGDYVPDGRGGLQIAQGREEILERVLFRLKVRRGSFPFLPELGSRLYELPREKTKMRQSLAERYVQEALAEEREVSVEQVILKPLKGDRLELTAVLSWQGETLTAVTAL